MTRLVHTVAALSTALPCLTSARSGRGSHRLKLMPLYGVIFGYVFVEAKITCVEVHEVLRHGCGVESNANLWRHDQPLSLHVIIVFPC